MAEASVPETADRAPFSELRGAVADLRHASGHVFDATAHAAYGNRPSTTYFKEAIDSVDAAIRNLQAAKARLMRLRDDFQSENKAETDQ